MALSTVLRRKVNLHVYQDVREDATLANHLEWHRQLSNAALQERIDAWQKKRISVTYNQQQNVLPALKKDMPELAALGSQALQETLRRVDRSFQNFFRRCKAGETPGFPRFKSFNRFNSFCYPSPAGWSYVPLPAKEGVKSARAGILRVGDLMLKVRGMSRFEAFDPNDLTLKRISKAVMGKDGKIKKKAVWEASITLRLAPQDCRRERIGHEIRGFDQGLTDRIVFDDGQTVSNSRLLRNRLEELACLQRARARCKRGSRRYKELVSSIAALHRKVAAQREDELHKLSTHLATTCELLATEELAVANMVRTPKAKPEVDAHGAPTGNYLPNGAAAKAGLNRELQSSGMGFLMQLLSYTPLRVACTGKSRKLVRHGTLRTPKSSNLRNAARAAARPPRRDWTSACTCVRNAAFAPPGTAMRPWCA